MFETFYKIVPSALVNHFTLLTFYPCGSYGGSILALSKRSLVNEVECLKEMGFSKLPVGLLQKARTSAKRSGDIF